MNLRTLFLQHVAQTSPSPLALEIVKAEGCKLFDVDGKIYLDLIAGISVSNLGHNHPAIKNAIIQQLDKYTHLLVYGELIQSPQVELAKYLTDLLPENLSSVYYVNSGSEAIEGALKLAKRVTGRTEIISFKNSYHGSTAGALSLGNTEERKNTFRPLIPDNRILDFNVFDQIENITEKTACVIMEAVQAEAGVILPHENYLQAIRKRCKATNTLLIFDEIQTGCGRTGKLFAFEKQHVIPDVLVLAKAFGGGMPLGAFIASHEMMQTFTHNPVLGHINTFGGHPVSCAAALASLKVIVEEKLFEQAESKAQLFKSFLIHPKIKEVRNSGLLIAIDFENTTLNLKVVQKCIENGVMTDWFLFADDCMRIAPPLIISEEEIKFTCTIILDSINSLS
ncbi:MAG: aspartate aminotransferase family protein [Bacteroidetes bacterium]|nr:aspartate aminotransferase family protein [Bacteroidota bacterium]MBP7398965.1 aspartate aminotransferase family protein [Chitinophagales bacterium]MBK7107794.1 aspartate aminotransferase family protein [Bacteroidota bacterium]MBK8486775.1 aspartate aminotransferase family protein [Bacteroidota bacterium]MBK8681330.1 aspartate aminotransferase family protein [Bacteroidota bacterium]